MINLNMNQYKRPSFFKRKILIMPDFQLTLIFWNLLISAILFFVVLLQIFSGMKNMRKMGESAGFSPDHPYYKFITELTSQIYFNVSIAFLLGVVIASFITLLVSHKLAGPLYRLRLYFSGLANGAPMKDISFRKGDYLIDLGVLINNALKKITKPNK